MTTCQSCGRPAERGRLCDDCRAEKPFAADVLLPSQIRAEIRVLLADLPDWHDMGACRGVDAELFFPERGASTREAKAICQGCDVRDECLLHAIEANEKFGIWGGRSERERRRIRRAMSKRGAA